ncbi:hypothetical protein CYMTET_8779, partial [Cymbomonas tetramitiformis]
MWKSLPPSPDLTLHQNKTEQMALERKRRVSRLTKSRSQLRSRADSFLGFSFLLCFCTLLYVFSYRSDTIEDRQVYEKQPNQPLQRTSVDASQESSQGIQELLSPEHADSIEEALKQTKGSEEGSTPLPSTWRSPPAPTEPPPLPKNQAQAGSHGLELAANHAEQVLRRSENGLVVVIPTVARIGVDYITPTVESIVEEAKRPMKHFESVEVLVVAHHSSAMEHPSYQALKIKYR